MNAELVLQCCDCRLVLVGTEYVPASPVKWAKVSHGYCRACADKRMAELAALIASEHLTPALSPERRGSEQQEAA